MRADEGRSDVEKTIARIIESKVYITGDKRSPTICSMTPSGR